jgi:hypothetical protein
MPQDTQPEFEWPPKMRLPQVPLLKVPLRRKTQFIVPPSPGRYTEEVPVMPPLAPEDDLFIPVPVTPPLISRPQRWMPTPPALTSRSMTGVPLKGYVPTGRRSRTVGNGEFLLGCAFLIVMALLALGVLTWLSSVR